MTATLRGLLMSGFLPVFLAASVENVSIIGFNFTNKRSHVGRLSIL